MMMTAPLRRRCLVLLRFQKSRSEARRSDYLAGIWDLVQERGMRQKHNLARKSDPRFNHGSVSSRAPAPTKKVAVYWDYENCPVPSGVNKAAVVQRIRRIVKEERWGEIEDRFNVFLDVKKGPRALRPARRYQELKQSGANKLFLIDCPHQGKKDVVDKKIIRQMVAYATTEIPAHQPTTLILITGDGDFTEAVTTLKWLKHTVVVIGSTALSSRLAASASRVLLWTIDVVPYAEVDSDEQLNCLFIGMIGLAPFEEESDSCSSLEPVQEDLWSGDAQLLIPRSFKALVQFFGDDRKSMVHDAILQKHLNRKPDWQEEYLFVTNYIQHAIDLDIVELFRSYSGEFYVRLKEPRWWDGFD